VVISPLVLTLVACGASGLGGLSATVENNRTTNTNTETTNTNTNTVTDASTTTTINYYAAPQSESNADKATQPADGTSKAPEAVPPPKAPIKSQNGLAMLTETEIQLIEPISFQLESAKLEPQSLRVIDAVAELMQQHPEVKKVSIEVHSAVVGNLSRQMTLSHSRALEIQDLLKQRGIASSRLTAQGFGATRPVDASGSAEAHDRNRRVEFRIHSQ